MKYKDKKSLLNSGFAAKKTYFYWFIIPSINFTIFNKIKNVIIPKNITTIGLFKKSSIVAQFSNPKTFPIKEWIFSGIVVRKVNTPKNIDSKWNKTQPPKKQSSTVNCQFRFFKGLHLPLWLHR